MILKRKMYNKLLTLKKELNGKKAFLIEGARRIGKSTICEEFGKNEYKSYILIDFARATETVKEYFLEHLNDYVQKGDTILVKASHFMKFEEVVKALEEM